MPFFSLSEATTKAKRKHKANKRKRSEQAKHKAKAKAKPTRKNNVKPKGIYGTHLRTK